MEYIIKNIQKINITLIENNANKQLTTAISNSIDEQKLLLKDDDSYEKIQKLLYHFYYSTILLRIGSNTIKTLANLSFDQDLNNFVIDMFMSVMYIITFIDNDVYLVLQKFKARQDFDYDSNSPLYEFINEYNSTTYSELDSFIDFAHFEATKKMAIETNNITIKNKNISKLAKKNINVSIEQYLFNKYVYNEIKNTINTSSYNVIEISPTFHNIIDYNKEIIGKNSDNELFKLYKELNTINSQIKGTPGMMFDQIRAFRGQIKRIEQKILEVKNNKINYKIKSPLIINEPINRQINSTYNIKISNIDKDKEYAVVISTDKGSNVLSVDKTFYTYSKAKTFDKLFNSTNLYHLMDNSSTSNLVGYEQPYEILPPNSNKSIFILLDLYKTNKVKAKSIDCKFKPIFITNKITKNEDIITEYEKYINIVTEIIKDFYKEIRNKIKKINDTINNFPYKSFLINLEIIFNKYKRDLCIYVLYLNIKDKKDTNFVNKYNSVLSNDLQVFYQTVIDFIISEKILKTQNIDYNSLINELNQ